MPKRGPLSMSDAQLRAALQGLRQEVAAPADFRARVLSRLATEGLLPAQPAPAQPSFLEQLRAAFSPARLALAGSAATLTLFVALQQAPKQAASPADAPALQPSPSQSMAHGASVAPLASLAKAAALAHVPASVQAGQAVIAASRPSQPAVSAQAIEEPAWQTLDTAPQASAPSSLPSTISAPSAAPSAAGGVAPDIQVSLAQSKPIEVVVKPTATPLVQPVMARSEVRQNVARLSRGEQALIYVRLAGQGHVKVSVLDRLGRVVAVLKDNDLPAGLNEIRWGGHLDNGSLAATGIYQVWIQAPGFEDRHKLLLVK